MWGDCQQGREETPVYCLTVVNSRVETERLRRSMTEGDICHRIAYEADVDISVPERERGGVVISGKAGSVGFEKMEAFGQLVVIAESKADRQ